MPVALPAEVKLPHEAHAVGAMSKQADSTRLNAMFFIIPLFVWFRGIEILRLALRTRLAQAAQ
jgi:hypothetical protein